MKYRFTVVYATKYMKQASEFMRQCDLDMGEIGMKEVFEFTSKKDIEIPVFKEKLKWALQMADCELLFCEGGKIE